MRYASYHNPEDVRQRNGTSYSQNILGMAVVHAFTEKMLIAKKKERLQYLEKPDSEVTIDRRTLLVIIVW
jgi:hypothetical protein